MKTITRKDLINNAQAYNKYLSDEHCKTLSNKELFANCHPIFREDNLYLCEKTGLLDEKDTN